MRYRTFVITEHEFAPVTITRFGKPVFTGRSQVCLTVEQAKKAIDNSWELWHRQRQAGLTESQRLHEAWYKKAVLFIEPEKESI